jgi:hypothetical protein
MNMAAGHRVIKLSINYITAKVDGAGQILQHSGSSVITLCCAGFSSVTLRVALFKRYNAGNALRCFCWHLGFLQSMRTQKWLITPRGLCAINCTIALR